MKIQTLAPKVYVPLLAVHSIVLIAKPGHVLSWSYALVLMVLTFTVFLAWRRLRMSVAHNRTWWTTLLLALVAQSVAFGLLLADSMTNPEGTLVPFDPTFYFCLSSLLLTLAAVYNPVGPLHRWVNGLDALLACAIAALFYALLCNVITQGAAPAPTAAFIMSMFDAMALFVVACVTLRFTTTKRTDERRFFVVLLVFAWAELVFPAVHNRFILSSESYLPEIFLDLPFVMLGLQLRRRRNVWFRRYRPTQYAYLTSGGLSPFVLSMALCLLAFAQLDRNRDLALAVMTFGILSYATRIALLLGHYLRQERELKGLQRELRRAIVHDDLTRLLNRRGFFHHFVRAWDQVALKRLPLTVALMDIDLFKTYNDSCGHLAGDDCLAAVARALQQEAAVFGDLTIARYGGEEFGVLLPGRDQIASEHILQRLRLCIEALAIANPRSAHGVVTMSVGAAMSGKGETSEMSTLLDQADQALYAAKREGRNCVRWFVPEHRISADERRD